MLLQVSFTTDGGIFGSLTPTASMRPIEEMKSSTLHSFPSSQNFEIYCSCINSGLFDPGPSYELCRLHPRFPSE